MCSGSVVEVKYSITDCVLVLVSVSGLYLVSLSAFIMSGCCCMICSFVTISGTACMMAFVCLVVGVYNSTLIGVVPKDLVAFMILS